MKTFVTILAALFLAAASRADTLTVGYNQAAPATAPVPVTANYRIHVDWHGAHGETNSLEVLTTDGPVELDTLQKSVKIGNNDVPVTLKLSATLKVLDADKGHLQLFLGRTVPYVTSTNPMGGSSYSQMSVGLQSNFIVTFGKPNLIQSDENGTVTVLVTRTDD
jgi:hypothetical protein